MAAKIEREARKFRLSIETAAHHRSLLVDTLMHSSGRLMQQSQVYESRKGRGKKGGKKAGRTAAPNILPIADASDAPSLAPPAPMAAVVAHPIASVPPALTTEAVITPPTTVAPPPPAHTIATGTAPHTSMETSPSQSSSSTTSSEIVMAPPAPTSSSSESPSSSTNDASPIANEAKKHRISPE